MGGWCPSAPSYREAETSSPSTEFDTPPKVADIRRTTHQPNNQPPNQPTIKANNRQQQKTHCELEERQNKNAEKTHTHTTT